MKNLKLYYLDEKYINYLRKFDVKVPYNKNKKRPYIGIVYEYNGFYYFAPLSSPKPKHVKMSNRAIDIFKIDDGKLGVVNINNMLPTPIECITELLPTVTEKTYKVLLENQLTYINNHKKRLFSRVNNFQNQYRNDFLCENVKKRSCDFRLLEQKCSEYSRNS